MRAPHRLPLLLLALLVLEASVLAISPRDRAVWALENGMALMAVLTVALLAWRFGADVLAPGHYVLVYVFLTVHLVGAHFTYTHTPGPWAHGRNDFDRLVHLSSGVLLAPPLAALCGRWLRLRDIARSVVPWAFLVAAAALFEVGEMTVALAAGEDAGGDYLGAQGDPFDAVWDMALAALGSAASLAWLAIRRRVRAAPGRCSPDNR